MSKTVDWEEVISNNREALVEEAIKAYRESITDRSIVKVGITEDGEAYSYTTTGNSCTQGEFDGTSLNVATFNNEYFEPEFSGSEVRQYLKESGKTALIEEYEDDETLRDEKEYMQDEHPEIIDEVEKLVEEAWKDDMDSILTIIDFEIEKTLSRIAD